MESMAPKLDFIAEIVVKSSSQSSYIEHGVWILVFDQRGELPLLPPCGVMDRDSTGEPPSALCPPQEAELTSNLFVIYSESQFPQGSKPSGLFPSRRSLFVCRRLPTNKKCPPRCPLRLRGEQIKQ